MGGHGIERINNDYKVSNASYDDYSTRISDNRFKKKLEEMNSIHVPNANATAYMPPGGIGNILNGNGNVYQNSDNSIQA